MGLIVDADHRGTSESAWSASDRLRRVPPIDLPPVRRALVVAPHPDDEVLGAGGLVQRLLAASVDVQVLAVTDGEGSHPGSSSARAIDLTGLRAAEVVTAFGHLGWDRPGVTRLGIPDGHVGEYQHDVARAVRTRLGPGDLCVAPWAHDGHPDHDAVGRASEAASVEAGATLIGYLVWAWHWADPAGTDLPWSRLARMTLGPDESARKRRAVRAFRSQTLPLGADPEDAPVLPLHVLRRFLRSYEIYVLGPEGS
jgi:LmbE family N-acetylglucosaminyl deacetylase